MGANQYCVHHQTMGQGVWPVFLTWGWSLLTLCFTLCIFFNYLFFFPKNFTALIPGTTVEILHKDSKNIIELIVKAYNVSAFNTTAAAM